MIALSLLTLLFFFNHLSSAVRLDDKPLPQEFKNFPKRDGKNINLANELAAEVQPFSSCLLDDPTGSKLTKIASSKQNNPAQIFDAVFSEWLLGRGRRPVKWRTILDCLRKLSLPEILNEIAEEMEDWRGKMREFPEEHHQPVRKTRSSTDDDSHPVEDKKQLLSSVAEVGDWEALCTHLGSSDAQMSALRNSIKDANGRRDECMRQYFDSGVADWGHVMTSVAEPPINNKRLACKIAMQHMGMDKKECLSYLGFVRDEL